MSYIVIYLSIGLIMSLIPIDKFRNELKEIDVNSWSYSKSTVRDLTFIFMVQFSLWVLLWPVVLLFYILVNVVTMYINRKEL